VHPLVLGELALGHPRRRREVLDPLAALPAVAVGDPAEALWAP
jgi:hypothetical protein